MLAIVPAHAQIIYEGPALTTPTDMSFETSGSQSLTTAANSPFGWSMFGDGLYNDPGNGLDPAALSVRTASRNFCNQVGNQGNNGLHFGFNTNQLIPGVPSTAAWNGEVHELWEGGNPTPVAGQCYDNNKYLWLLARGGGSDPGGNTAVFGIVHPLAQVMNAGDVLSFRGWYGWKTMTTSTPIPFTFRVGLVPVGGSPLDLGAFEIMGTQQFPSTSTMNWAQGLGTVTATEACDRVILYFKGDLAPLAYYRFFLDDVNMSMTLFGAGMAPENTLVAHSAAEGLKAPAAPALTLAPNPNHGVAMLHHPRLADGPRTIEVLNSTGSVVAQLNAGTEGRTPVDLTGLSAGIYLMRFPNEGRLETVRCIKE